MEQLPPIPDITALLGEPPKQGPVIIYGAFDAEGVPQGFYPSDLYPPTDKGERNEKIPSHAIIVPEMDWQRLLVNQPYARYIDGKVVILEPPPIEMPKNPLEERIAALERALLNR